MRALDLIGETAGIDQQSLERYCKLFTGSGKLPKLFTGFGALGSLRMGCS